MSIITQNFSDSDAERFLDKVALPDDSNIENACWIWQGAHHSKTRGYGKFRLGGKPINAHKAAYLLFNGPVKSGLVIGHVCNNEQCVNPYHLVAQTQSDNMAYAVICGRHNSQRH